MSTWFSVTEVEKIQPGSYLVATVNDISLVVVNSHGRYFALENVCTHDGGELTGGVLEEEEIICPRHGAGFCIKTGAVTRAPAYEDIKSFPLRVREGYIEVQL
jgi:3-phenylpropionate/trans-cinnamate dioxygenase ferredoxin component